MDAIEIIAYKAETARVKAQDADRPQQDADRLAKHEAATRAGLKAIRDADHENALLENLPCELCGRIEPHPNHRGTGHTHTPAVTPEGRASALVAYGSRGNDVPEYVFTTALMMVSSSNPGDIVMIDQVEAGIDEAGREVVPDLRATGAWTATTDLDHVANPDPFFMGNCLVCGRVVHNRYDDSGNLVSSAHYA